MASKRANPQRIKLHQTYTVEDAARTLDVHKNTVRGWLAKGLEPIDRKRPMLFDGKSLRAFLKQQRKARKKPCPPGTMYCLKCREPRTPALGMADFRQFNTTSGLVKALCGCCGTIMNRRTAFVDLKTVLPEIEVQISEEKGSIS